MIGDRLASARHGEGLTNNANENRQYPLRAKVFLESCSIGWESQDIRYEI